MKQTALHSVVGLAQSGEALKKAAVARRKEGARQQDGPHTPAATPLSPGLCL